MTLTSYVTASELFRLVAKKKTLRHPTAATFSPMDWLEAAATLQKPNARDISLLMAALYFGQSIGKLRESLPDLLTGPFTREGGIRLLAAAANEQYIVLTRKMRKASRKLARREPGVHVEQAAQLLHSSATGQQMTGDDHVTHLIDTLPHWLHHLRLIPQDKPAVELADPFAAARSALVAASAERGLRDLWHSVLWEGREVVDAENARHLVAKDERLAELWLAWSLREQANMSWEAITDAGAAKMAGSRSAPVRPVQLRTVVGIERLNGRRPRILIGRADGTSPRQRAHLSDRDMLERLYTGLFMDEPLPATGALQLTCRELCLAWWVLCDLGQVLLNEVGDRVLGEARSFAQLAMTWPVESITRAIAAVLGIDESRAESIIGIFTLNPPSTSSLFGQSLWWTPIVPAPNGRCHLVLAPLFLGNPVRLVEHWLEVGGISDQRRLKGRGIPFEAHVRRTLTDEVAANPRLHDAHVFGQALARKGQSEEIDLLVRIGDVVIVGEVKCYLSPVEPSDRHNYLLALESAAEQARRKARWIDENRSWLPPELLKEGAIDVSRLRIQPLIVLNQGHGLGLILNNVPVTDLHYLSLLLGSGAYQAETGFSASRMAGAIVTLYRTQAELEAKIATLLGDPPPLRRYGSAIDWSAEPFPSPDGKPLMIHLPRLTGPPADKQVGKELLHLLAEAD